MPVHLSTTPWSVLGGGVGIERKGSEASALAHMRGENGSPGGPSFHGRATILMKRAEEAHSARLDPHDLAADGLALPPGAVVPSTPGGALERRQWRREELAEFQEGVLGVTPHRQVRVEVAHAVPQLHLKQVEGPLDVPLRVDVLPSGGRAGDAGLLRPVLRLGPLLLRRHLLPELLSLGCGSGLRCLLPLGRGSGRRLLLTEQLLLPRHRRRRLVRVPAGLSLRPLLREVVERRRHGRVCMSQRLDRSRLALLRQKLAHLRLVRTRAAGRPRGCLSVAREGRRRLHLALDRRLRRLPLGREACLRLRLRLHLR
mmetsp:Transcript_10348/g.30739  ORF Transcript_10348/g.30739 Transcript_10348/m.30739 type:complete len:314 (+) Transcript_10348:178-1119(+)